MKYELLPYTRHFDIRGAYDLRRPEPARNYGIHNAVIVFAVSGAKGAVSLTVETNWYLNPADASARGMRCSDLGTHSKAEPYAEAYLRPHCEYCGGPAYCGGSGLEAAKWQQGFLHGGTAWLWPRLEAYYDCYFYDAEYPDLTPIPCKHPDEEPTT